MSETHTHTLNLKALGQNIPKKEVLPSPKSESKDVEVLIDSGEPTDKQDTQKIDPVVEKPGVTPVKMSFASIRKQVEEKTENSSNTSESETKEVSETIDSSSDKEISLTQKNDVSPSIAINKDIEISETKNIQPIIEAPAENDIKKPILTEEKQEKKKRKGIFGIFKRKKVTSTHKKSKNGDASQEVQFTNYESHFTKESSDFLSKFQKFKYTPKTRVGLVLSLICITIFTIGALMVMLPNKHSPEIYKASLLQILGKEEIIEDIPLKLETIQTPIQETMQTTPNITKQEESKERLRQHLLNKYSG